MTETVDSDKREGECVCVCVCVRVGVSSTLHLPFFFISISHPSVFHWERRGASDGSGRGEGTEKS